MHSPPPLAHINNNNNNNNYQSNNNNNNTNDCQEYSNQIIFSNSLMTTSVHGCSGPLGLTLEIDDNMIQKILDRQKELDISKHGNMMYNDDDNNNNNNNNNNQSTTQTSIQGNSSSFLTYSEEGDENNHYGDDLLSSLLEFNATSFQSNDHRFGGAISSDYSSYPELQQHQEQPQIEYIMYTQPDRESGECTEGSTTMKTKGNESSQGLNKTVRRGASSSLSNNTRKSSTTTSRRKTSKTTLSTSSSSQTSTSAKFSLFHIENRAVDHDNRKKSRVNSPITLSNTPSKSKVDQDSSGFKFVHYDPSEKNSTSKKKRERSERELIPMVRTSLSNKNSAHRHFMQNFKLQ